MSKRFGPPLIGLMDNGPWPETEMVPFYEAIFECPDLDLSVPSTRGGGKTLREYILATRQFPLLHDFVHARD